MDAARARRPPPGRPSQRWGAAAVIELLAAEACCLSAQEIADRLRGRGRPVGTASVYRALDLLTRAGIVARVEVGGGGALRGDRTRRRAPLLTSGLRQLGEIHRSRTPPRAGDRPARGRVRHGVRGHEASCAGTARAAASGSAARSLAQRGPPRRGPEPVAQRVADRALLGALDELLEEALDHQALRLGLGEPVRAQIVELLGIDLSDRGGAGAATSSASISSPGSRRCAAVDSSRLRLSWKASVRWAPGSTRIIPRQTAVARSASTPRKARSEVVSSAACSWVVS